uniref:Uncharacterized protein n=1 Tax=Timema bartmani TaxID=61472 RepID=A0A7R9I6X2_9NEOP|nr:unnamed protein product [Timema bartmani]
MNDSEEDLKLFFLLYSNYCLFEEKQERRLMISIKIEVTVFVNWNSGIGRHRELSEWVDVPNIGGSYGILQFVLSRA